MSDIRKERAFDGRCTIFAGKGLIISGLSDETADLVVAHLSCGAIPDSAVRSVGGRRLRATAEPSSARVAGRRPR